MYRTEWTITKENAFDGLYVVRYSGQFMASFAFESQCRWYVANEINTESHAINFKDDGSVVLIRKETDE